MRKSNEFGTRSCWLLASSVVALSLTVTTAGALTIDDTFLSSFTGTAVTEAQIQAATNAVATLYSNSATINILFGADSSLMNGAESETVPYLSSYTNYTNLLGANSALNPANTTLATAVANLPNGNGANGRPIVVTPAQLQALGVNVTGNIDSNGNVAIGTGIFDGIINIGTAASISAVIHELDEVLGGGGQGSYLGAASQSFCSANFHTSCYGSLDLYRYSAPGVGSFSTDPNATAYLSVDGGVTNLANFNQSGVGDSGDFTTSPCLIQSWEVCSNPDTFIRGSVEDLMLQSIGYDPAVATPLPAALPLFATGLGGLGLLGRRRKRRAQALA
jgi:hypothetical protein